MRLWLMTLFSALQYLDDVFRLRKNSYPTFLHWFSLNQYVYSLLKNTHVYKVKCYVLVSLVTNVHKHAIVFLFFYKVNIGMFYICWPAPSILRSVKFLNLYLIFPQ